MRSILIICLCLVATEAMALRCGNRLVQTGDYKWDVLEKCGPPEWQDERMGIRGTRLRHPFGALQEDRYEEVLIEEWVYNFGPRKFKQFLQFENGVLIKIRNLEYGH